MSFPAEQPEKRLSQQRDSQEQYIHRLVQIEVAAQIDKLRTELKAHADTMVASLETDVKSAFPNDDILGHRRFHDQLAETQAERKALAKDIRAKAVTGVLWVVAALIATAIWEYIKREVKK